jgi:AcrR family transcriptional regulator
VGILERKERQKAELRDTILAAARRIFTEEGAEALTMRRIADAIEYSPGTIYTYFANREEIALQLVREGFEKLLAGLAPAMAVEDPLERLRAIGRAYVAFGIADRQTYKLIFMEDAAYVYAVLGPSSDSPDADDPGRRAFGLLTGTIGDAIACGAMPPRDAALAADGLWAALHGVLSLTITCPRMMDDPTTVGAFLADTLIAGLRTPA